MNAQELTKALGGRWSGSAGTARCPSHDDHNPSLSISDGDDGKLLVRCHAKCEQDRVIAALKARGLWPEAPRSASTNRRATKSKPRSAPSTETSPHQDYALKILREARPAPGTPVEDYLRGRRITTPVPPTLRYNPGVRYDRSGLLLPCMVAAVQAPDRKVTAIHRTFIRDDGKGKAGVEKPKMALGPFGAGAVRLGPAGPVLGIAEGVETGLSAMQLFDVPVWCSLSAVRLARLWLPPEALEVHLFADNGTPGHEAAERAARVYQGQGRRVVVRFPPEKFGDFNDLLRAGKAA